MIKNRDLYKAELHSILNQLSDSLNKLKGMRILVTGASGMIGSYLVDLLMEYNNEFDGNLEVFALSRTRKKLEDRFGNDSNNPHLHVIEGDIRNPICIGGKVDYIIHAASNTHPIEYAKTPVETVTTNVIGMNNVFEYARKNDTRRVVVLSSVEIYGENNGNKDRFDENSCGYINCNTLRAGYPESKRLCEAMAQAYKAQYGVDSVIVRLSRVFGPGVESDDSKAMTQFINNAARHENIVLKSSGEQMYSYTYISDAISAILMIMLNGESGEAYNVADPASDCSLKTIAGMLSSMTGGAVVYESPGTDERNGYSTATKALLDGEKLKTIGWEATYNLYDGLKRTLQMMDAPC